jgi:hypothetical protein
MASVYRLAEFRRPVDKYLPSESTEARLHEARQLLDSHSRGSPRSEWDSRMAALLVDLTEYRTAKMRAGRAGYEYAATVTDGRGRIGKSATTGAQPQAPLACVARGARWMICGDFIIAPMA